MEINKEQRQAVSHRGGPALVLAGPGSGKTTVITTRCAQLVNLMESNELKTGGILTVAFNRAAAKEMGDRYERVYKNISPKGKRVDFSTFHSFCNSTIYRYEQINKVSYTRLPEKGEGVCKEKILDSIYSGINSIKLTKTELNKLSNELGRIKNNIKSGPELSMSNFKKMDKIYEAYERFKRDNNYIDFDDMLYMARDIFLKSPYILKEVQNKYMYFQVDEGQDLSEVQLDILKLLSDNIFIVGDDDQGIYGFRGASPESIVNIEKYFSNCSIYYLKQNYRSTERIVDISGEFIKQNPVRFDKNFITELGKGKKPKCRVFLDDEELLAFIYAKISASKSGTCGILYRNGASSTLPMIMCYKKKIPFKISGGTGIFFSSFVSNDVLDMFMYEREKKSIFQRKPEKLLRDFILDGYLEHMKDKCERLSLRFEDMMRYLCAWDYLVRGFSNCNQVINAYNELKNIASSDEPKVYLSTIHSAKGLEYDSVFMIDLYKGEFPKNCGEEELCEERRLFYVGMTRAKKYLYMLCPSKRRGINLEPGEFFKSANSL